MGDPKTLGPSLLRTFSGPEAAGVLSPDSAVSAAGPSRGPSAAAGGPGVGVDSFGRARAQKPPAGMSDPAALGLSSPERAVAAVTKPKTDAEARTERLAVAVIARAKAGEVLDGHKRSLESGGGDKSALHRLCICAQKTYDVANAEYVYSGNLCALIHMPEANTAARKELLDRAFDGKMRAIEKYPDAIQAEYVRILSGDLTKKKEDGTWDTSTLLRRNTDDAKALRAYVTQDPEMQRMGGALRDALRSELDGSRVKSFFRGTTARSGKRDYPALAFAAGASAVAAVLGSQVLVPKRMVDSMAALIAIEAFLDPEDAARFVASAMFTMGDVSTQLFNQYLEVESPYRRQQPKDDFSAVRTASKMGYSQAFAKPSEAEKGFQHLNSEEARKSGISGQDPVKREEASLDARESLARARGAVEGFVSRLQAMA